MKFLQVLMGMAAIAAAAGQCYYLLGVGQGTTNVQPLTAGLYILFFWILWAYGRRPSFIAPIFSLGKRWVRGAALAAIACPLLMACVISGASNSTHAAMMKFGALNAVIMAAYLLVALVLFFGDQWLGFVAKLLKFGREFPRDRSA